MIILIKYLNSIQQQKVFVKLKNKHNKIQIHDIQKIIIFKINLSLIMINLKKK